jgi:molybdopterin converting factor small subunit
MTVTVRAFAAAAESLGAEELSLDVPTVASLRELLSGYSATAPEVISRCSMLRDGDRLDDDRALHAGDVVDVLPPFAGG